MNPFTRRPTARPGASSDSDSSAGKQNASRGRAARNSIAHTLLFAILVAAVFGAMVSVVSVLLEPAQKANMEQDQQLLLKQLMQNLPGLDAVAKQTHSLTMLNRWVQLETGCYADRRFSGGAPGSQRAHPPVALQPLTSEQDLAQISERPQQVPVHLTMDRGTLRAITLPVYGLGYTSQLRGYLTLSADGEQVLSLVFYDQRETPGMGGRIGSPDWPDQWLGKRLHNDQRELRIGVATATPTPAADAPYQIDAMSGATVTGRGITNLLRFWLGPLGFEPYLANLKNNAACTR